MFPIHVLALSCSYPLEDRAKFPATCRKYVWNWIYPSDFIQWGNSTFRPVISFLDMQLHQVLQHFVTQNMVAGTYLSSVKSFVPMQSSPNWRRCTQKLITKLAPIHVTTWRDQKKHLSSTVSWPKTFTSSNRWLSLEHLCIQWYCHNPTFFVLALDHCSFFLA